MEIDRERERGRERGREEEQKGDKVTEKGRVSFLRHHAERKPQCVCVKVVDAHEHECGVCVCGVCVHLCVCV